MQLLYAYSSCWSWCHNPCKLYLKISLSELSVYVCATWLILTRNTKQPYPTKFHTIWAMIFSQIYLISWTFHLITQSTFFRSYLQHQWGNGYLQKHCSITFTRIWIQRTINHVRAIYSRVNRKQLWLFQKYLQSELSAVTVCLERCNHGPSTNSPGASTKGRTSSNWM